MTPDRKRVLPFFSYRKVASVWHSYHYVILTGLWLCTLLLGYIGFDQFNRGRGEGQTPLDNLFLALSLFVLGSGQGPGIGIFLQVARWLAPLVASATALQAAHTIFREQIEAVRLSQRRNHVIICGLGDKGWQLVKSFTDEQRDVVVIERRANNEAIQACRDLRIPVLVADATEVASLKRAGVLRACSLLAVCDKDITNADIVSQARILVEEKQPFTMKSDNHSTFLRIVRTVAHVAKKTNFAPTQKDQGGSKLLVCVMHLVNDHLRDLLEERVLAIGQSNTIRINFFNVYDSGARSLLVRHPFYEAENLDSSSHVLLVGLGLLGQNLIERAAVITAEKRLHVTIIDPQAEATLKKLAHRTPVLKRNCDYTTYSFAIDSLEFESGIWLMPKHSGNKEVPKFNIAYVCLEEDDLSLAAALRLRKMLGASVTEIIVCLHSNNGLSSFLQEPHNDAGAGKVKKNSLANLQMFSLLEGTCNVDLLRGGTNEVVAQAIYEKYIIENKIVSTHENSTEWANLSEVAKESNRSAADFIGKILQAINCDLCALSSEKSVDDFAFTTEEVENMAKMEHGRWKAEKEMAGWSFAESTNKNDKKHCELIPWHELGKTTKERNRTQVRNIPRVLKRAGYEIVRLDS